MFTLLILQKQIHDAYIDRTRHDHMHDMYTCPLHFTAHNIITMYYKVYLTVLKDVGTPTVKRETGVYSTIYKVVPS